MSQTVTKKGLGIITVMEWPSVTPLTHGSSGDKPRLSAYKEQAFIGMITKIVSSGQTGTDQGALDAAISSRTCRIVGASQLT